MARRVATNFGDPGEQDGTKYQFFSNGKIAITACEHVLSISVVGNVRVFRYSTHPQWIHMQHIHRHGIWEDYLAELYKHTFVIDDRKVFGK